MKPFAKLFETEIGQIVAMTSINEDWRPEIRFHFDPGVDGLDICSVALAFPEGDRGEAMAAEMLRMLDGDKALNAIRAEYDMIRAAGLGKTEA